MFKNEKGPEINIPKSFIRINKQEHNLAALLKLLKNNNIEIRLVSARNPDPEALSKVTTDNVPVVWSQIELQASYDEVRRVLESSEEFKESVDKLLGSA